ncbi:MAG: hypothetical protein UH788_03105 [Treponemataceae bacterium]|nr:hypothetical protein [Treponemataceae bacterium]
MKNRLHDKKAGIFILVTLIIVSVAEVGFRHMFLRDMITTTANYAETLAVIGLALTILIFTLKGKDRICYILYGAWVAYFVLDQVFELPGSTLALIDAIDQTGGHVLITVAVILRILSMICIIVIGGMLVEYMNDGTINNRIFNTLSGVSILMLMAYAIIAVIGFVSEGITNYILAIFNILYQIIMVFLFAFFAYDSAKKQLNKVDFSK